MAMIPVKSDDEIYTYTRYFGPASRDSLLMSQIDGYLFFKREARSIDIYLKHRKGRE